MRLGALAVLALVNLALAAGLAYVWHDFEQLRWVEPAPMLPALGDELTVTTAPVVEISRYRETIARPLFAASRRPAPVASQEDEAGKAAVDPLKDFRLLGFYAAGDRGGAIIFHGGQVQRVPFGEKIAGWTVTGADTGGASLVRRDGESRSLLFPLAKGPARPAVLNDTSLAAPAETSPASAAAAGPRPAPDSVEASRGRSVNPGAGRPGADDANRAAGGSAPTIGPGK